MIKNTVITIMESDVVHDFRRLMYLARNNAWVNVNGIPYQLRIPSGIKISEPSSADAIVSQSVKVIKLSVEDENQIKLILGKLAKKIRQIDISQDVQTITLPNITLKPEAYTCYETQIKLSDDSLIYPMIKIVNFDHLVTERLNSVSPKKRIELIEHYNEERDAVLLDAAKNEIWLAVSSGDSQMLAQLLDEHPTIDIHGLYKGKNILQALFSFDPKKDLPFSNVGDPNWKETVQLLIEKAHLDLNSPLANKSYQTGYGLCQHHEDKIANNGFFRKPNLYHTAILDAIKQVSGVSQNVNINTQFISA